MPHVTSFGSAGLAPHNFWLYFFTYMPAKSFWINLPSSHSLSSPCWREGRVAHTPSQRNIWAGGAAPDQFQGSAVMWGQCLGHGAELCLPWAPSQACCLSPALLLLEALISYWLFLVLVSQLGLPSQLSLATLTIWIGAHFFLISSEEGRVETCIFVEHRVSIPFYSFNPRQILVVL